jgi:4a-hydroxytetrahydrobiopterin dehydratase
MHQRLNSTEIDQGLKQLNHWALDAHKASICNEWDFDSFKTAMRFFLSIGELAEKLDHHPELSSNFRHIKIRLTTHDAYGLTNKDFELAIKIDQLIKQEFSVHLR